MKKITVFLTIFLLCFTASSYADMEMFQTYTGDGMSMAIDAWGGTENETGTLTAEIPDNATIEAAYLYSVSVWSTSLYDVTFNGTTLTSDSTSKLDVGTKNANSASENRWDVTSIVNDAYTADTTLGTYDFSITESGYLDGEILSVVYSVSGGDTQTVFLLDGELATTGDGFTVTMEPYDGSDVIMSLGISFGYQSGDDQYTLVDVNGERLTTSAGGEDDGYSSNGGLITAGGYEDSTDNPADPNGFEFDPRQDDELYNLASFLDTGDTAVNFYTRNPSNNDNVFFAAIQISGEGGIIDDDDWEPDDDDEPSVPEPSAMFLLGTCFVGLAALRKKVVK